jgi:hypothetical protein
MLSLGSRCLQPRFVLPYAAVCQLGFASMTMPGCAGNRTVLQKSILWLETDTQISTHFDLGWSGPETKYPRDAG